MDAKMLEKRRHQKKKIELRRLQPELYECALCKHAFPHNYILICDGYICLDRQACFERSLKKYDYYVKAKEAPLAWWKELDRKLGKYCSGDDEAHRPYLDEIIESMERKQAKKDAKHQEEDSPEASPKTTREASPVRK